MKKLFSCQFGSRLYGTQTPTSDIDIKHIVLPDINQLLLGRKLEAKVKKTNNVANTRNSADDIDEEFIPLQIFARHFVEGQTYAIELAFAVDGTHCGQALMDMNSDGGSLFSVFGQELREKFLTSNIKAMIGYVVNQTSLYSFKGERLNATRELKALFEGYANDAEHGERTVGDHYENTSRFHNESHNIAIRYPKYFRLDQYDVGGGVMRPCFVILEKTIPFTNSTKHSLTVLKALEGKYGSRSDQASESNVDWKATMHALRIVDEGLQLLGTKKLSFPFDKAYADRLLSIKRGELPLDPIKEELATKLDQLKDLEKNTDLPECNQEFLKEFDVWMVSWLHKFYNL
jgi:hypothetical protein